MATAITRSASGARLLAAERVWDASEHAAFTDLARFRGAWYLSFREGARHVGGPGSGGCDPGRAVVLRSADGERWERVARFAVPDTDLRDPKLSETPDGRLLLLAGAARYEDGAVAERRSRVWFSADGARWTDGVPVALRDPRPPGTPERDAWYDEWLWRAAWHDGQAWGVSYSYPPGRGDSRLVLLRSADGVAWERVTELAVPGLPSEVTVRGLADGSLLALIRRERASAPDDGREGWIGRARAPYLDWTFRPCGHRLGGPNFIALPDGRLVAGSRAHDAAPGTYTTVLAWLTPERYEPFLTLPSGGDTSYPGLVWHDGALWVSWYSSHEGQSAVYVGQVQLPPDRAPKRAAARADADPRAAARADADSRAAARASGDPRAGARAPTEACA